MNIGNDCRWIRDPEVMKHWLTIKDLKNMNIGDTVRVLVPYCDAYSPHMMLKNNQIIPEEKIRRPAEAFEYFVGILELLSKYSGEVKYKRGSTSRINLYVEIDLDRWAGLSWDGPSIESFPDFAGIGDFGTPIIKLDQENYLPDVVLL
jgi:hypothetical protein